MNVNMNATHHYLLIDTTLSACGAKALLDRECPVAWIKYRNGTSARWVLRRRSKLSPGHPDFAPGMTRYIFSM